MRINRILVLCLAAITVGSATVATTSLQDAGVSRKTLNLPGPKVGIMRQDLEPKATTEGRYSILLVVTPPLLKKSGPKEEVKLQE